VYSLAKVKEVPKTPTKFLRDNLNNDDIEKCKPATLIPTTTMKRDLLDTSDISGSKPKPLTFMRRHSSVYDSINYNDVT
jgi:hypothetical protein